MSIKCQMKQGVDGAEFSIGHVFVFAGEKTPDNYPCQCGEVLYNENTGIEEQLTKANERVAELEEKIYRMKTGNG